MNHLQLNSKLKLEKSLSSQIKAIMISKGFNYDVPNNSFHKNYITAYFNYNRLIFHFEMPIANNKFNPYHIINIKTP